MSQVRAWLRSATRAAHDRVDEAFGAFRLDEATSYRAFLSAHRRALVPLEDWLEADALLPGWQGRSAEVTDDLRTLGERQFGAVSLAWTDDEARRIGALYVLEGSRMGAAVLARSVSDELPKRYLTARAAPGQWHELLRLLESKGGEGGAGWQNRALAGANDAFALFHSAAQEIQAAHR